MATWLSEFVLQHQELESPTSFWMWSALTAISAVVKDNIFWDKYAYNVYPNVYVMLHADSGLKKGPPISAAKQMVMACNNTKIIVGRSSIQAILADMSKSETLPGGKITSANSAFICASELASSLVSDPVAMSILTDMYDRNYNISEWRSLLKAETFTLKAPVVTMFTATNAAHNEVLFGKQEIQGGFFARTFIIHESKRNKINSLMFPLQTKLDYKKSAEYLKELLKLRGPFTASDEVRHFIKHWYEDFTVSRDDNAIKDETGTLNRFDDSMLKVAMLLNLANEHGLDMQLDSIKESITICEKLVGNVRRATLGSGKNMFSQQKALIIEELIRRDNHTISRMMLNKKFWTYASMEEWDSIIGQLEAGGIVKIETAGNQVLFRMVDSAVIEWRGHLMGK